MATETVSVDNPYGIQAMWAQGDYVTKGVLVLLVLMSAYSWFIIFTKWWEQRRLLKQAHEAEKSFWAADNIKSGLGKLTGKGNIFKAIAAEAIDAAEHHDSRLTQQVPLHESVRGLCILREKMLDYVQENFFAKNSLELCAEEELERRLGRFFDLLVCGLVRGYERALRLAAHVEAA